MRLSTLVGRYCAAAFVLFAAACSDMPTTAPSQMDRPSLNDESDPLDSKTADPNSALTTSEIAVLHIDPRASRTYSFGQHWIYIPAFAICDTATSGYGPELWDAPCSPLQTSLDVTVRWNHRGGHAYAQFSPELRFAPPTQPRNRFQWVILGLHDHKRIRNTDSYQMLYNAPGTTTWIDESKTDPTLKAWLNAPTNTVLQRIKHFSGYMVTAVYGSSMGGMGDASY